MGQRAGVRISRKCRFSTDQDQDQPAEQLDPVLTEPEPELPQLPEAAPITFLLLPEAFRNLTNASDLQDQLKARGYPAEVMITENRMYRVSVASYATKRRG